MRALAIVTLLATPAAAQDLTPLSYHLNWLPQAEHCGFFQAQANGLYEAAGLEVTLLAGGRRPMYRSLWPAARRIWAWGRLSPP